MSNIKLEYLPKAIEELVKLCQSSNAGIVKVSGTDKEGETSWALVVLDGPDTQEVLDSIDKVTETW